MRPEAMTLTLRDRGLSTGRQKLALAAIVCLPVPVLAGSGLAIPLPPVVYRVAVAVADGAHVVAVRLPGVGAIVEDASGAPRAGKIKLAARELAERPQHTVRRRGASPARERAGAVSSGVHSEQRRGTAVLRPRPTEEAVADPKPATTSAPAGVAPAAQGDGAGSETHSANPALTVLPAAPAALPAGPPAPTAPLVAVATEPAPAKEERAKNDPPGKTDEPAKKKDDPPPPKAESPRKDEKKDEPSTVETVVATASTPVASKPEPVVAKAKDTVDAAVPPAVKDDAKKDEVKKHVPTVPSAPTLP